MTQIVEKDMAAKEHDQEFVEYVVQNIVNHPADVRTERIVDERGVLITLHINPEDMGYVIGRQGQTFAPHPFEDCRRESKRAGQSQDLRAGRIPPHAGAGRRGRRGAGDVGR